MECSSEKNRLYLAENAHNLKQGKRGEEMRKERRKKNIAISSTV